MKKILFLCSLFLLSGFTLSGCGNTLDGMGRDIENMGESIRKL